mgnify:CR=1 FL=1
MYRRVRDVGALLGDLLDLEVYKVVLFGTVRVVLQQDVLCFRVPPVPHEPAWALGNAGECEVQCDSWGRLISRALTMGGRRAEERQERPGIKWEVSRTSWMRC